ncbi:quaternary amine ABC transporter ATP-binding protein [Agrococcus casei]|uniref:L-proline glycine betaine ABC transport system permease protein ProV (TC 3.A.1.12.1) n=1 Tax=Agrococcus casei LMG 22410 TaxID=1255656 RepID=A0A1R4F5A4_9MICO|nr:glycine betaine/L-proline ABC transporter ATP-binding protein [Agrococcus casei]SJM51109.1 L-proline glycine betaine ABC transport system permease protein ProV (TC 3.A.1.12.1) [Agrococcus casei LMG 22410]
MSQTEPPERAEAAPAEDRRRPDGPAIKVENVYKVFGRRGKDAVRRLKDGDSRDQVSSLGVAAVIDAAFQVEQGEIFVVMGLSGSGKSTLIRMLNGLNDSTDGQVTVFGSNVVGQQKTELRRIRREHLSMVFQHFALLPHRTVIDNVAYGLEIQGVSKTERLERAAHWINKVGLGGWENHFPDELSGGMKQRVGLARAFAADTDILLMDEAFSALDPLIRREMQEQLKDLQQELGKTIVFITHDLNEAMFLGDRIAVMRDGKIVQVGTPNDILTDPANDYVAQFVQDVDRARVLSAADVMERPQAVVAANAGPRAALRTMRDLQTSASFVTSRDRKLLGVVFAADVLRLVRKGADTLEGALHPTPAFVAEDQLIVNVLEMAVDSPLPVAVVDAEERLVGVVPRVTLLAALASTTPETDQVDIIVPPDPVSTADINAALEATADSGEVSR